MTGGIIDSPIERITETKKELETVTKENILGNLYAKRDDSLAVCGSLKARGGIYTIFKYAEEPALQNGLLKETDDYKVLNTPKFKEFFHSIKFQLVLPAV